MGREVAYAAALGQARAAVQPFSSARPLGTAGHAADRLTPARTRKILSFL
jgi:hypothetical protein